ncbi:MAG: hypothetical protein JWN78_275 [Bacteroidota bacterium]|nr:hypothetical protein [Bacteroidota bacterium]
MKRIILTTLVVLLGIIAGCKKGDTITSNDVKLDLKTMAISNLTLTSAATGGEFLSYGKDSILEKGVCWSTTEKPTVSNSKTSNGWGSGNFVSSMTGLTPLTYYFVRSYATTKKGTTYGTQVKFITSLTPYAFPVVTTTAITNVTNTSAQSGGNVTTDSGSAVIARGVCWSTSHNPTIADSKTTNGTGTGTFTSVLSGLTPNTTYYVRAYATNGAGTAYGSEFSLTTLNVTSAPPTVITSPVTGIFSDHAASGGNVTSQGGTTVISRGVCWATHTSPTLADNLTLNGTGTGSFGSSLTGLSANTTYYVRAYATNSAGTSYGNEITFMTSAAIVPTLTTNPIGSITTASASSGGNISSDGGAAVTTRGVCWNTTPGPTIVNSKTTNGTGTGSFTSFLTGLASGTTYYVRAYATNSAGTAYGNEVSFATSAGSSCGPNVTDIDGNIYNVVEIGTQCWLKQNLKVKKYNNGDPVIDGNTSWNGSDGKYCYYNNDAGIAATYGNLYNWYAVTDSRNLCPSGWHAPSDAEWATLVNYLGGESTAGKHLKEAGSSHWNTTFSAGDNSSGFTGLPGSDRSHLGTFNTGNGGLGNQGIWWSTTVHNTTFGGVMKMGSFGDDAFISSGIAGNYDQSYGFSVRCIKN